MIYSLEFDKQKAIVFVTKYNMAVEEKKENFEYQSKEIQTEHGYHLINLLIEYKLIAGSYDNNKNFNLIN